MIFEAKQMANKKEFELNAEDLKGVIERAERYIEKILNREPTQNTEWGLGYWEGRSSLAEELLEDMFGIKVEFKYKRWRNGKLKEENKKRLKA